jgi:predicted RNA-binding protein YlxR (DUF448 family)
MQEGTMPSREPGSARQKPERTCVGCGQRDGAGEMLRLLVAEGEVAFDLAGGGFGRGAHLHPRPTCIEGAPRGLARSFGGAIDAASVRLGARLVEACERRVVGLLLAVHRLHDLEVGADASIQAMNTGAPLLVIAADAGAIARSSTVARCIAEGRAIAWSTKTELGALLGEGTVAICAVRHPGIAAELKRMRVAADAGLATVTDGTGNTSEREGAGCRSPEAR